MSNIKVKRGVCIDCGPEGGCIPLIAGRCQRHYWQSRKKISSHKPAQKEKVEKKDALTLWFAQRLIELPFPAVCENCHKSLRPSMVINPRTVVCHIVPKSTIPEVACHHFNVWYGCQECHDKYDNGGILSDKVLLLIHMRLSGFFKLIKPENRRFIPKILQNNEEI